MEGQEEREGRREETKGPDSTYSSWQTFPTLRGTGCGICPSLGLTGPAPLSAGDVPSLESTLVTPFFPHFLFSLFPTLPHIYLLSNLCPKPNDAFLEDLITLIHSFIYSPNTFNSWFVPAPVLRKLWWTKRPRNRVWNQDTFHSLRLRFQEWSGPRGRCCCLSPGIK